jgi:hypothetical protein
MAIEKNIPSQLDPEELAAEVELELPGSMDENIVQFEGEAENMDIEVIPEDDGGVSLPIIGVKRVTFMRI